MTFGIDDDKENWGRINTVAVRKDGAMTKREQASFDNLVRNIGDGIAEWMPKLRPGMDEEEYAEQARATCRTVMDKFRVRLQNKGVIKPVS